MGGRGRKKERERTEECHCLLLILKCSWPQMMMMTTWKEIERRVKKGLETTSFFCIILDRVQNGDFIEILA